jgi:hypothetical protein
MAAPDDLKSNYQKPYARTPAESNLQHGSSKAGFPCFVIARYQEMLFTSDNQTSRK